MYTVKWFHATFMNIWIIATENMLHRYTDVFIHQGFSQCTCTYMSSKDFHNIDNLMWKVIFNLKWVVTYTLSSCCIFCHFTVYPIITFSVASDAWYRSLIHMSFQDVLAWIKFVCRYGFQIHFSPSAPVGIVFILVCHASVHVFSHLYILNNVTTPTL